MKLYLQTQIHDNKSAIPASVCFLLSHIDLMDIFQIPLKHFVLVTCASQFTAFKSPLQQLALFSKPLRNQTNKPCEEEVCLVFQ